MEVRPRVSVRYNYLASISDAFGKGVVREINKSVAQFLQLADRTVPVRKGFLKGNKTIVRAEMGQWTGSVTYNQHYAVYVHEGTVRSKANPWARNAANVVQPGHVRRLASLPLPSGSKL